MAASGIVKSVTFTPDVACDVELTVTYECNWGGSDWGANSYAKLFMTQSSSTTYADTYNHPTGKLPKTLQHVFSVAAGSSVEVGLYGGCSGTSNVSFYNIDVKAVEIKR